MWIRSSEKISDLVLRNVMGADRMFMISEEICYIVEEY